MKAVLGVVGLALACATQPNIASACSPPPGDVFAWQRERDRAYLSEVTSIYVGVFDDMAGRLGDSLITFKVRRTGSIWGESGPATLSLQFHNGSCAQYLPFWLDWPEGSGPQDGLEVLVFMTPASRVDPDLLYIVPTGPEGDAMMAKWREASTLVPRRQVP